MEPRWHVSHSLWYWGLCRIVDLEHRGKDSFYSFRHPLIHLKYFHFFPLTANTLINIWPIESSFMKLPICRFFVEIEKNKLLLSLMCIIGALSRTQIWKYLIWRPVQFWFVQGCPMQTKINSNVWRLFWWWKSKFYPRDWPSLYEQSRNRVFRLHPWQKFCPSAFFLLLVNSLIRLAFVTVCAWDVPCDLLLFQFAIMNEKKPCSLLLLLLGFFATSLKTE